ncbi:MAG: phosphoribosylformylglycinamidine synthase subunit PurL [Elusimicrobiota bacterium]
MRPVNIKNVEIIGLPDEKLIALSKDNVLSLSLLEMKIIQKYFKGQGRNPTDAELETIAQTWSEHCKHKTLTGVIKYTETEDGRLKTEEYQNLLKETIFKATKELKKKWCISVFEDNAGVIEFNKDYGIAFKVETHNHPSALEPYGGAATGIGGVIRDILGVGLGAKPVANTDVFCFGPPELEWDDLPDGMLHPKRIAKGVVSGVRDYGNRMGIPTVNGAVYFDEGYISNPLVYCGTLGMIPTGMAFKKVKPGDLVLVAGGRTGRDGIHGATFSSTKLHKHTDATAVQIGNPIVEKKVLDTLLKARDMGLYRAVTDCGAGGLSSAVGELGAKCGVTVNLEKVPLKYAGLAPWEIWLSEAQERMVFAVPKEHRDAIMQVFESEGVEATFIGEFTKDKKLIVLYKEDLVVVLDMQFLHDGVPRPTHAASWEVKSRTAAKLPKSKDLGVDLKHLLSSLNICSREWIIRQYDHEVQGQTVIKPLQGRQSGPGDAAVIWPYTFTKDGSRKKEAGRKGNDKETYKGIVLSNGLNPEYGKIDPYWMAASAIDEALRNAVAVGADIERTALLDNFCWGSPDKPEVLGGLVRASTACYEFSKAFETPFISGKDSLHNEYIVDDKAYSIPPALLISAVGIITDIRKAVRMDFKHDGSLIYVIGATKNELGGSQYLKLKKTDGGELPKVDAKISRKAMISLGKAMQKGLVAACHDCSEGGLGVAIAEMCFAGGKGATVELSAVTADTAMSDAEILFSESNSRFIVEVGARNRSEFEKLMKGVAFAKIGVVEEKPALIINGQEGKTIISEKTDDLQEAWRKTLNW